MDGDNAAQALLLNPSSARCSLQSIACKLIANHHMRASEPPMSIPTTAWTPEKPTATVEPCGIFPAWTTPPAWTPPAWADGVREGYILLSNDAHDGPLPSLGNGFVSTIADSSDVYLAGVFSSLQKPLQSHRAKFPSAHRVTVTPEGGWPSDVRAARALDTRHGLFLSAWSSASAQINVTAQLYAHRARRGLLVSDVQVHAETDTTTAVRAGQQHPQQWLRSEHIHFNSPAAVAVGVAGAHGLTVHGETGSKAWAARHPPVKTNVSLVYSVPPDNLHVRGGQGGGTTLRVLSSFASNLTEAGGTPFEAAAAAHAAALATTPADLYAEHCKAWERLYSSALGGGRLDVRGPSGEATRLTRVVGASLYAILSAVRTDAPYGLSPGGLSTDGYKGHTFWDQETWMLPPLLALAPTPLAASVLQYRARTVEGAYEKAEEFGYRGAMFAWESCVTGTDQYWFGDCGIYEHHITADIGMAFEQCACRASSLGPHPPLLCVPSLLTRLRSLVAQTLAADWQRHVAW